MKSTFDNQEVSIACPKCNHETKQKVARLRGNPKIHCPACSAEIAVDARQLDKQLGALDRQIADLSKRLSKTIKLKL